MLGRVIGEHGEALSDAEAAILNLPQPVKLPSYKLFEVLHGPERVDNEGVSHISAHGESFAVPEAEGRVPRTPADVIEILLRAGVRWESIFTFTRLDFESFFLSSCALSS